MVVGLKYTSITALIWGWSKVSLLVFVGKNSLDEHSVYSAFAPGTSSLALRSPRWADFLSRPGRGPGAFSGATLSGNLYRDLKSVSRIFPRAAASPPLLPKPAFTHW